MCGPIDDKDGKAAPEKFLDSGLPRLLRVCWDYFRLARDPPAIKGNAQLSGIGDLRLGSDSRATRYSGHAPGLQPNYGRGRSSSTTSERSCTRSRTTSWPSGEMSKSRMSKSGVRFVNCRSTPVSRSMSQRFLC
jgi:hypothetical protein